MGGKRIIINTGELFFVTGDCVTRHTISYHPKGTTWQFYLNFYNDSISASDLCLISSLPEKMLADDRIMKLIESVYLETTLYNDPDRINADFLFLIGTAFLDNIYGRLSKTDAPSDRAGQLVHRAMLYIERCYHLDLNTTDIATQCGVSRDHLIHTFRKCGCSTPIQCLWDFRLKTAAILLENTLVEISEIAERCGFKNVYHFSKRFKRKYDIPPGRYRRS